MPRWAILLGVLVLMASPALATAPAAIWFEESLLCRQDATGAVGELWLDPDGRYAVFYDRGHNGAGRHEGLTGRYGAKAVAGGIELCLRPDADLGPRGAEAGVALFHDAGCLVLKVRPIGETFTLSFRGQAYTLVLAQGR